MYERTNKKIETFKNTLLNSRDVRECAFKTLKQDNKMNYLNSLPILITSPLNPREAFFGRQIGSPKTYH